MKEKSEFQKFFDELANLLSLTQENLTGSSREISPDIETKLAQLEHDVDFLKQLSEKTIAKLGIQEDKVQELIEITENLPEQDRHAMEQLKKFRKIVDNLNREYTIKTAVEKRKETLEGKASKKKGQTRKKKFDQMGGRKDWKPL